MRKSSRVTIVLDGAHVFCFGVLALLLSSPCDSGVTADNFTFSGFQQKSLHTVPGSNWNFDPATGCFHFDSQLLGSSGRILYPFPVQTVDPTSATVKSFSTSFIYRFERSMGTRPGMAFIICPDNVTLGARADYMGLTSSVRTTLTDDSDKHTLGVELDTFMNPEFNDFNRERMMGRSADSSYSFTPSHYQQICIEYPQADSRMDIYVAGYKAPKPDKPQGSISGIDLSLLMEKMFTGFSSASYDGKFNDVPIVCAWGFNNDDSPAPSIVLPENFCYVGMKKSICIFVQVLVTLILVCVGITICVIVSLCCHRFVNHPLRIFISHAGGPNGCKKNFPTWLNERMRTYRWSVAKSHVRIFFDREGVQMGKSIAKKILRELARFDVGVVVVTYDFFVAKWPMTELIAFVEAQKNDPFDRIRVLPLFYELSPEQVRAHLDEKFWEGHWEEMSKGNHPLKVKKCRQAVSWLCQQRGIPYSYERRNHDGDYIETVCENVDEILCKKKSFALHFIEAVKTYCIDFVVTHCKQ